MAIGIIHAYFSQTDRFDFRSEQNNPGNEFFNKFVVETRPFVPDVDILLKRCLHGCKNSKRGGEKFEMFEKFRVSGFRFLVHGMRNFIDLLLIFTCCNILLKENVPE